MAKALLERGAQELLVRARHRNPLGSHYSSLKVAPYVLHECTCEGFYSKVVNVYVHVKACLVGRLRRVLNLQLRKP